MMRVFKIALALILATGLVMGIALPGLAAPKVEECPADGYQLRGGPPAWGRVLPRMQTGKVAEIDEGKSFFVIQRGEQEPIKISVDDSTKYVKVSVPRRIAGLLRHRMALRLENQVRADEIEPIAPTKLGLVNQARLMKNGRSFGQLVSTPGGNPQPSLGEDEGIGKYGRRNLQQFRRSGEEATFAYIDIGDRVAVCLVPEQDEPLAKLVLIFEPAAYNRLTGTITDVSLDNQTITIAPTSGDEEIPLNYDEHTSFTLKGATAVVPGQSVSAIYHGEDMMAKVVRVHPESE